jgi:hypothetical protein
MKAVDAVLVLAAALQLPPALAQYPASGDTATQLPADTVAITYQGSRYYFGAGLWFQQVVAGFVVVSPPAGIVVPQLPPSYTIFREAGVPYYRANGVYYASAPGGYVVVPQPAPQGSWYYCDSAKAYYPYVRDCAEGWSVISSVPPQLR